jgi:hypothetical protein
VLWRFTFVRKGGSIAAPPLTRFGCAVQSDTANSRVYAVSLANASTRDARTRVLVISYPRQRDGYARYLGTFSADGSEFP